MTRAEILAQVKARMAGGGEQSRTKAQILEGVKSRMAPVAEPAPLKDVSDKEGPAKPEWTASQVDEDVRKTVASTPARVMAGIMGLPGYIDQIGRDLDQRFGFTGERAETPLATQESLMERGRGMVSPEMSDTFLHDPQSTTGAIVGGTLDMVGPGVSRLGQGRRALEGAVERVAPSAQRLRQTVDAGYGTIAQADVGYNPANWNALSARLNTMLGNSDVSPNVRSILSEMNSQRMAQRLGGNPIRFEEIEETYKKAGRLAARKGASPNDVRVLTDLRNELDDFRRNSPTVSGNMSGAEAMDIQTRAREQALRQIKDRRLERIERAGNRMPSSAAANREVDNQINRILRSNQPLTDDELAMLHRVGGGGWDILSGGGLPGQVTRAALGTVTGGALGYGQGGDPMSVITGAAMGALGQYGSNRLGAAGGRARRTRELKKARESTRLGPRRKESLKEAQKENLLLRAIIASTGLSALPASSASAEPVPLGSYLPQDDEETYFGPAGVRG